MEILQLEFKPFLENSIPHLNTNINNLKKHNNEVHLKNIYIKIQHLKSNKHNQAFGK